MLSASHTDGTALWCRSKVQVRLIFRVLWSPSATFRQWPSPSPFLLPFCLFSLLSIVISLNLLPIMTDVVARSASQNMDSDMQRQFLEKIYYLQALGIVFSPVATLIKWALMAWLIYTASQLADGRITYRQAYSLTAYASIIPLMHSLVVFAILKLRGADAIHSLIDLQPPTGMNLIFKTDSLVSSALLQEINVFEMWYVLILATGIAAFNRFSIRKALLVVLPVWLFLVVFKIAFLVLAGNQN